MDSWLHLTQRTVIQTFDHIAGPQARGGVDIIPPLQDFVDGFAEFLSEALGLIGKLPREELVAVFGDERLDAGVTQQYTDPRLGVPGALLDGGAGAGARRARRGPQAVHHRLAHVGAGLGGGRRDRACAGAGYGWAARPESDRAVRAIAGAGAGGRGVRGGVLRERVVS